MKNENAKTPARPLLVKVFILYLRIYFNTCGRLFRKRAAQKAFRIFFSPKRNPLSPERQAFNDAAVKDYLLFNQQKIRTYSWGNPAQKTVLLVHGWEGTGVSLAMYAEGLIDKGYRVIGFDGLAHGESPGKQTNMKEHAGLVQAMLKAFPKTEAIICHSFGGAAAIYALGNMKNHEVKKLLSIASPTRMSLVLENYMKVFAIPEDLMQLIEQLAYLQYGLSFSKLDPENWLPKIPATRFLFIHDKSDLSVPYSDAIYLHQKFPATKLISTNGLGHNKILWDKNIKETVINFIASDKI